MLRPMFKTLFHYPWVISRHANGPLADARNAFLSHLAARGTARTTLLHYASELLLIAGFLDTNNHDQIERSELAAFAQQWAKRQRRLGCVTLLKWPADLFFRVACSWCDFMGWLKEEPQGRSSCAVEVKVRTWASFLRSEEELAETTTSNYCWWANCYLRWLKQERFPLRLTTPGRVDQFMIHLSVTGHNRVTLASAAKVLRRFLAFAHGRGWCRRDSSQSIYSPRLYRRETVPIGPAWADVRRLIAATNGPTRWDLRNRAILLLLAVYGLRSGEVRRLRLEDLDWTRRILRVRRTKTAQIHEYPLTAATGQAIRRYLKAARPHCNCPEVFLTIAAPFRRLSTGGMYCLVSVLLARLGIASPKHGPHALRHACATYLLNSGLSLKKVGDHLGHANLSATQIYAKTDLVALRAVAAFDLGGLI